MVLFTRRCMFSNFFFRRWVFDACAKIGSLAKARNNPSMGILYNCQKGFADAARVFRHNY
jgi:hypothetical protein